MRAYAGTNIGLGRSVNQDAYYVPVKGEQFCVIADGMGGHRAGEVASALAVQRFSEVLKLAQRPDEERMRLAVKEANKAVYEAAMADAQRHGMGTTLTAVWFDEDQVMLSHIGDSRAYLLRNRALMQLTRDHSLVGELLEHGEITPSEARVHPHRNMITRAVGTGKQVKADLVKIDYRPQDIWLLCTDGLSNFLTNPEMAEILARPIDYQAKVDRLIELSLARGGSDNITAVIVVGEDEPKGAPSMHEGEAGQ